jgi:hypothetical protein
MAEIDHNKFIEMLVAEPEFNLAETKIKTFSEIVPKTRRNVIQNLYLLTKAYPYKSWRKEQGSYGGRTTVPRDIFK